MASETVENCSSHDPLLDFDSTDSSSRVKSDEYIELQFRVFRLAFLLTFFSVGIAVFFWGIQAGASLFMGALSGIFYFRLLARGIGRLGTSSNACTPPLSFTASVIRSSSALLSAYALSASTELGRMFG